LTEGDEDVADSIESIEGAADEAKTAPRKKRKKKKVKSSKDESGQWRLSRGNWKRKRRPQSMSQKRKLLRRYLGFSQIAFIASSLLRDVLGTFWSLSQS
jgi:hypothetical protein